MELLKVGDNVYEDRYGKIGSKYTIDRVTKNFAFAKDKKFCINHNGGIIDTPNRQVWSTQSFYIETPAIKERYIKNKLVYKLSNYKFADLPIDVLLALNNLLPKLIEEK